MIGRLRLDRLTSSALIYSGTAIANRFLAVLLLPMFTRFLTPADYGVTSLIGIMLILLSGPFALGSTSALGILFAAATRQDEKSALVWTTAAILTITSVGFGLVAILTSSGLSWLAFGTEAYSDSVNLAIATLGVQTVTSAFSTYFLMSERRRVTVALSLWMTTVTLATNVLFIAVLQRGVRGYFEAGVVSAIVSLASHIAVTMRYLPTSVNPRLTTSILKLGMPSVAGVGAFFIIDYADRFIVQRLVGDDELGRYSLGYSFGMAILLIVRGFASAWPPYFLSYSSRLDEAKSQFGQILKLYIAVSGAVCLGFFAFARPTVELLTTHPFHSAQSVVGWIALAYALRGMYLIMLPGIYFAKKLHLQSAIEWVAAGVLVVGCLLLVPTYYKEGAAIATVASYASLSFAAYLVGQRYLRVRYPWRALTINGILFAVLAIGISIVSAVLPLPLALAAGVVTLAAYALGTVTLVLNKQDRGVAMLAWREAVRR